MTKDAFNSLYHYQIKHSVLVNFSISKNSALRALSALLIIVSEHAQWFRRGGVSVKKIEIEIIASSPVFTS